jgi:hypothetical protein
MAGYDGYSMSNNARTAYATGEMPKSKWSKAAILAAVQNAYSPDMRFDLAALAKVPLAGLRDLVLVQSSWHHTSSHYNRTDFYAVNEDRLSELTNADVAEAIDQAKAQKAHVATPVSERWECEYLVWSGSRKHPKAKVETAIGEIRGDWFYLSNGSKKSITAKGFVKIRKIGG